MRRFLSVLALSALALSTLVFPATAADYDTAPHLARDIAPGASASFIGTDAAVIGTRAVFAADATGGTGSDLWITDGSTGGTKRLKDFAYPDADPQLFKAFGGKAYFVADDGISGIELWVTDGTTAGTHLVADLWAGAVGGEPHDLTVAGNGLYFAAKNGNGEQLWRLSAPPTVGPPAPPVAMTPPLVTAVKDVAAVGTKVAFSAGTAATGYEPWISGGTPATTAFIGDVNPGNGSSSPAGFTLTANGIVFRATTNKGTELWRSDVSGSPGSTALVKDIWSDIQHSNPKYLFAHEGRALFKATDATGSHLWSTDGTPAGTVQLSDVSPGSTNGDPAGFTAFKGKVYFDGTTAAEGSELWMTDGTAATTQLVKSIAPSASGGMPHNLSVVGGRLFFVADTAPGTTSMWRSDGTALGTVRVSTGIAGWDPEVLATISNTLVFSAKTAQDRELWTYTTLPSITKGYSKSVTRKTAAARKIYVTVTVRATGTTPTGRVVLKKGSTVIGYRTLVGGNAKVRIVKKLAKGKHKIRAYYYGSVHASTSRSVTFVIKVR